MAQVDPNKVINKLAIKLANAHIQLAMQEVALEEALEAQGVGAPTPSEPQGD
jgi:hypothetical protein